MDKRFFSENTIELNELVYAPLKAVSDANNQLGESIVDFLAAAGDIEKDAFGKPVVRLRTIQMMYDQIRSDEMDNPVSESIGLEVPLLTIFQPNGLKVSKTKVAFEAEIKGIKSNENETKLYTRIGPKKCRDGDHFPKLTYEVELESVPVPEGLMRFVDTLNTQFLPKKFHSTPIDDDGRKLVGKKLESYKQLNSLCEKEKSLIKKLGKIKDIFRAKNNIFKAEEGMDFEEYAAHIQETGCTASLLYKSMQEYDEIIRSTEERIVAVQEEIAMYCYEDDCINDDYESGCQDVEYGVDNKDDETDDMMVSEFEVINDDDTDINQCGEECEGYCYNQDYADDEDYTDTNQCGEEYEEYCDNQDYAGDEDYTDTNQCGEEYEEYCSNQDYVGNEAEDNFYYCADSEISDGSEDCIEADDSRRNEGSAGKCEKKRKASSQKRYSRRKSNECNVHDLPPKCNLKKCPNNITDTHDKEQKNRGYNE